MKKSILLIFVTVLFAVSCKNNKKVELTKKISNELTFAGSWTRSFEMGNGVAAKVTYNIWQDSIHYDMLGPMHMQYTIKKDTFIVSDNKWIGRKDNISYVIFAKNTSKDSISLLKMKVENMQKALEMKFPSDSARSKFSSWNTYIKN